MSASENATNLKAIESIDPPSEAYEQATDSPVYRLSELMFGSLLASYVLGFIGFLAAQIGIRPPYERWDIFLMAVKYTSISVAYAYLTASFYLSYIAGILTMHHMPLKRLGYDFILALAQAVLFGYSMLYPRVFPIHLTIILSVAILRQYMEHKDHVKKIYRRVVQRNSTEVDEEESRSDQETEEKDKLKERRREFVDLLKQPSKKNKKKPKYPELAVWKPAGRALKVLTLILFLGGALVWYLVGNQDIQEDWTVLGNWKLPGGWRLSESWIALESSVVAFAVLIRGHMIIRDRADFLYNRKQKPTKMDKQFRDLLLELQDKHGQKHQ